MESRYTALLIMLAMSARRACAALMMWLVVALSGSAQAPQADAGLSPAVDLTVSAAAAGVLPPGWFGGPKDTVAVDEKIIREGTPSIRMVRTSSSDGEFSTLARQVPVRFAGEGIEVRAYLRTEDVSNFAGIWVDEQKAGTSVAFINMQHQQLKGTTDWAEYAVKLPLREGAETLSIGVLLSGTGKLWASDLQLWVDGKPASQAPQREAPRRQETVLDRDHQFDSGSAIHLGALQPSQVNNLVTLGKVWGFLKYYHPVVTSGGLHWDYELLRVLPKVLAAPDRRSANAVLADWVQGLGAVKDCNPCVQEKTISGHGSARKPVAVRRKKETASPTTGAIALFPDHAWLSDTAGLGASLSRQLLLIEKNRVPLQQFYVSQVPGVGNAVFEHEPWYGSLKFPDPGFQLLALYRFWNIVEYWAPYKDQVSGNWDDVLREHLPKVMLAKDKDAYLREMMALIAAAQDTHANLWSGLYARPPVGECRLPFNFRFLRGEAVVASRTTAEEQGVLHMGDVVDGIDGRPLKQLITSWSPYYAASNEAARFREMAGELSDGPCGPVSVIVRRDHKTMHLEERRLPSKGMIGGIASTHDLPGPAFQRLSANVVYLKLSSVKIADIEKYLEAAKGTDGWIIDIRNYPSEFVVFALTSHLLTLPTTFARFTNGELSTPGTFKWTEPERIEPKAPFYPGKVVILVDEVSQSQAEYTAMALRAGPHAVVVGSTTAGTDGNVSELPLPGGQSSMISGIGVFYPDGRPTQQVGIVPNRSILPTVPGIREGRDEVLERGVREIVGESVPAAEIERMIREHPQS